MTRIRSALVRGGILALVRYGIDAGRINTVSYGEERPVDTQHSQQAWARNRRDEFSVAKQ